MSKHGFMTYNNRPFVKNGNTIYYGYPYENYVIMMQILDEDTGGDTPVPTKLMVQLVSTDEKKSPAERIVKNARKESIAEAFEIADIWLNLNK